MPAQKTIKLLSDTIKQLHATLDQVGAYVFTKDVEGRYTFANKLVCDLFGHPLEEVVGSTDERFFDLSVSNQLRLNDRRVLEHGERIESEEANVIADTGETRIYWSVKVPMRNANGAISGLIGVSTDITAQKNIDYSLRQSEQKFRQSMLYAPIGFALVNSSGRFVEVNPKLCSILGFTKEELLATQFQTITVAEDLERDLSFFHKTVDGEIDSFEREKRYLHKQGHVIWAQLQVVAVRDESGKFQFNIVQLQDITERKRLEQERLEALSILQNIAGRVPGVVYQFLLRPDGSSCFPYASEGIRDIYRVSPAEVREDASKVFAILHPDDFDGVVVSIQKSARDMTPWQYEYRVKFADGSERWLFGNSLPQKEADGSILWHGFITDITQRKQDETELRIAATAFESQEGMLITDADGLILRVNRAFTGITGYSTQEVVGRNPSLQSSGRHDAAFYAAMWESIRILGSWEGDIWNRRKNGEIYPEHLTISAVKDANGNITNYVATSTDITLKQQAEEEIKKLAFYDTLTQLPNRRLLNDRIKQALACCARSKKMGAILFIDLDNFKNLNDTLGHDIGDVLLQRVGERLTSSVREGDTVARFGGDEFVVILEDLSEKITEAAAQVEVVGNKILNVFNAPFQLSGHEFLSTTSIGAALFNGQQQSTDELLKQSDIAMYQAKNAGRSSLRFFDPTMQEIIIERAALERELSKALAKQQFKLYFQIQVDESLGPIGAEALIRWIHPERGMVSPADFIPLAEETGFILPVGEWVLEQACSQLKKWEPDARTRNLVLSVNISAKQLRHADFVTHVQSAIQRHAIHPNRLKLEITESMLLENIENTISTMSNLKEIGVQFSLDDFGTGYSSLQYLKRLPLDQLKIDQSFVRDIVLDGSDRAIVRTIIAMAQSLNLEVIAEGVETEQQQKLLIGKGCTNFQGYLFGKPVQIEQFEALLANHSKDYNVTAKD